MSFYIEQLINEDTTDKNKYFLISNEIDYNKLKFKKLKLKYSNLQNINVQQSKIYLNINEVDLIYCNFKYKSVMNVPELVIKECYDYLNNLMNFLKNDKIEIITDFENSNEEIEDILSELPKENKITYIVKSRYLDMKLFYTIIFKELSFAILYHSLTNKAYKLINCQLDFKTNSKYYFIKTFNNTTDIKNENISDYVNFNKNVQIQNNQSKSINGNRNEMMKKRIEQQIPKNNDDLEEIKWKMEKSNLILIVIIIEMIVNITILVVIMIAIICSIIFK